MSGTDAHKDSVTEIRRLAEDPTNVRVTERATYDLLAEGLTKDDVCAVICSWIDERRAVKVTITSKVLEHAGSPQYVMKPEINGRRMYVKVALPDDDAWLEQLVLISCHE